MGKKQKITERDNREKYSFSRGQTLIETVVAAFILTMGISAVVGLAIFAYNSSSNVSKQITAMGLGREGLEAVKLMRDTNWITQDPIDADCYDFASDPVGQATAQCYRNWLGTAVKPYYCINPSPGNSCNGSLVTRSYNLEYNSTAIGADFWTLNAEDSEYGLNVDPGASGSKGFYYPSGSLNGNSEYYRKIILEKNSNPPFNTDVGPELKATVQVWWVDRKCPRSSTFEDAKKSCRLEMQYYMSNWKNY